jgi:hypothetical protein
MVTLVPSKLPHGGPGTTEEGAAGEEAKKRLNHTFASSSTPSAFHLLEVLITRVVGRKPARSSCNVVFVLRAMHLGTGHFFCL